MLIYFCSHSKASVDMMADQKINYKRCYREVFSLSRQTDRKKYSHRKRLQNEERNYKYSEGGYTWTEKIFETDK